MKTSVTALHHQHTDWLRELGFYKDEIAILTHRLEEVAKANTSFEVSQQVEHFQNRFIILRDQVDVLNHDVKQEEASVLEVAAEKPQHIHQRIVETDDKLLERMQYLSKSLGETRYEFNAFAAKTL